MKKLFTLLMFLIASPAFAAKYLTIAPDKLSIECRYVNVRDRHDHRHLLIVKSAGIEIYRTTPYSTWESCRDDADKVWSVINAAWATRNNIGFRSTDRPAKDFKIAGSRSSVMISPKNLYVKCFYLSDHGINQRLEVDFRGHIIYRTSEYGLNGCENDEEKLRLMFNSAEVVGKLIEFNPLGDWPKSDFSISDRNESSVG